MKPVLYFVCILVVVASGSKGLNYIHPISPIFNWKVKGSIAGCMTEDAIWKMHHRGCMRKDA